MGKTFENNFKIKKIVTFSRGYSFQKSVMTLVLVINIIVYI